MDNNSVIFILFYTNIVVVSTVLLLSNILHLILSTNEHNDRIVGMFVQNKWPDGWTFGCWADVHKSTNWRTQMVHLIWFGLVFDGFFLPHVFVFTFDKHESEIIINQRINGRYLIPSAWLFSGYSKINWITSYMSFPFVFLTNILERTKRTHTTT